MFGCYSVNISWKHSKDEESALMWCTAQWFTPGMGVLNWCILALSLFLQSHHNWPIGTLLSASSGKSPTASVWVWNKLVLRNRITDQVLTLTHSNLTCIFHHVTRSRNTDVEMHGTGACLCHSVSLLSSVHSCRCRELHSALNMKRIHLVWDRYGRIWCNVK